MELQNSSNSEVKSAYALPGINIDKRPAEIRIQEYFDHIGYTKAILQQKNRKKELVLMRFIFMWNLRTYTNWSFKAIGQYFLKDHASVVHGIKMVNDWLEFDPVYAKIINHHNRNIAHIFGKI